MTRATPLPKYPNGALDWGKICKQRDALLAAAEAALRALLPGEMDETSEDRLGTYTKACDQLRAAIKLAKGDSNG